MQPVKPINIADTASIDNTFFIRFS
jgi:hypothetical protein